MTLSGKANKVTADGIKEVDFKAIPYCTWNNRGADYMAVWIPSSQDAATVTPKSTIASHAVMYSEPTDLTSDAPAATSNLNYAWGYNDQWEPKSSADTSKPYHYWWLRQGSNENVCYAFAEPQTISSVDVYWLDFDHYDGNFRTPEKWELYYKDHTDRWVAVKAKGVYGVEKNKYNHVDFDPVQTTALKVSAKLRDGASGGVIEWKVN